MGVAVEDGKVIQAALKIRCVIMKAPFSYLGSKVGGSMLRVQSWDDILDRVSARLSNWKMKTLSIGGRLTLIKSILGSIPIYNMSIFKVPMKARVIKAIHETDGKIGSSANANFSSIWVDIIREVEKIKMHGIDLVSFIKKKIGNGVNTLLWEEKWCEDIELRELFPRLYMLEDNKDISVATKLNDSSLLSSFRRVPRGGVEQSQTDALLAKVSDVDLVNMSDRWCWSLNGSGDFFVASVRKLIDDNTLPAISNKTRLVKAVPIKVNIHAWKVRLDCLPTRLNISRRVLDIDFILCPTCDIVVESSSHIFFSCHLAREIFHKITRWWDVSYSDVSSYEEWLQWILNTRLSDKYKNLLEGMSCRVLFIGVALDVKLRLVGLIGVKVLILLLCKF
ncbi:RNA-directed DNA polymerase, eukaryota, reverse transcriptase zinc-binding domain protein [Tanacetum coccineum]